MDPLVITQIVVAAGQDILFAVAAGALACGVMSGHDDARALTAAARWQAGAACLLVPACLLYLWLQAAVMAGTPLVEAGPALIAVLTQSHYGIAWMVGAAGAVVLALGSLNRTRTAMFVAAVGGLVYVAGKAAASHAADAGDFRLPEAVHVVHLSATALWAGSVIVGAWALLRWEDASLSEASLPHVAFCTRLSHLATIALVIVIVTGIFNVTQATAHLSGPLLATMYGRVLTTKLALVACTVMLGGWNRMVYLPHMRAESGRNHSAYLDVQRSFERLLVIEALAMLGVLIVAAVLGHTSPSGG